jgi:hypothetical protein
MCRFFCFAIDDPPSFHHPLFPFVLQSTFDGFINPHVDAQVCASSKDMNHVNAYFLNPLTTYPLWCMHYTSRIRIGGSPDMLFASQATFQGSNT